MLRLPRCDRLLAGPGQQNHAGADRPTTLATGRRSPRSRRTTAQAQLTTNSPHFEAHDPRHGERPSSTSLFAKTPLDDLPSEDIISAAHTVRIRRPPAARNAKNYGKRPPALTRTAPRTLKRRLADGISPSQPRSSPPSAAAARRVRDASLAATVSAKRPAPDSTNHAPKRRLETSGEEREVESVVACCAILNTHRA